MDHGQPFVLDPVNWAVILFLTLAFTGTVLTIYYRFDTFDPEPKSQVFMAFIYGLSTPIFTLPIYYTFNNLIFPLYDQNSISFIELVLFAPIVEELFKGWLLLKISNKYRFDGPMDGIVYGIALGSGFATIENLIYGISTLFQGGFVQALQLTVIRGGFAFIGHPIYTAIFGWGIGAYQVGIKNSKWSEMTQSILFHLIWNGMFAINLVFPLPMLVQIILVLFVIVLTSYSMYARLRIARNIEIKLDNEGYYDSTRKHGYYVRRK